MRTIRSRAAIVALVVSVFVFFSSSVFAKGDYYGKGYGKDYSKSYSKYSSSKYSSGYDKDKGKDKYKGKSKGDKYSGYKKSKYKKNYKKKHYRKSHKKHHEKCIHETESCECDGQLTTLVLRYIGFKETNVTVLQHNGDKIYSSNLKPGQTFALTGTDQNGNTETSATFGPKIHLFETDGTETEIHTSCSIEIVTGDEFGNYRVLAGTSRNNGAICEGEPEEECDPLIEECEPG